MTYSQKTTALKKLLAAPSFDASIAPHFGLLALRLMLGTVGIYHGGQKLFGLFGGYGIRGTAEWMNSVNIPMPTLSAIAVGSAEFFGGLLIALGLGTRLAALPFAFTMFVASFTVMSGAFDAQKGGMEYPLTLGVALFALATLGGGRFSATQLFKIKFASTKLAHA